jgi:hypothetical protein
MDNSVVIQTLDGHDVSLTETGPGTAECVIDGSSHELTSCVASADCTKMSGQTTFMFWTPTVEVSISNDVVTTVVTYAGFGDGTTTSRVSPADSRALVAFVRACKLPRPK